MYYFYSFHSTCGKSMLFIILFFNSVRIRCVYLFSFMYGKRKKKVWLLPFKTSQRVTFALSICLFFEETCIDSFCSRGRDKRAVKAVCHCSCSAQTKTRPSARSPVKLIINGCAVIWPKSHKRPDVLLASPWCALTIRSPKSSGRPLTFSLSLYLFFTHENSLHCFFFFNAVRMESVFLYKAVIGL